MFGARQVARSAGRVRRAACVAAVLITLSGGAWPGGVVDVSHAGPRAATARASETAIGQAPRRARARPLPPGITPATKAAIDRGLAYLARTQRRQGFWENQSAYAAYPVAMTALAGVALLMDGNTTTQGRYALQVDRAVRYLVASSTATGLIAQPEEEARPMYGHGFSMMFLGQVYGMLEDPRRTERVHDVLVRAIVLTGQAQSRDGGWIYTPDGRADEGSVTVTQVQALRSCRNAGIAVPKAVIDDAMAYLAMSQNSDGGIRYTLRQRQGASRPPLAAAAVCCWFNAGQYRNPRALRALSFCKTHLTPTLATGRHDFYAHLYYAQALYVSGDDYWNEYFTKMRDQLLAAQKPDGHWVGDGAGDIYGTAAALIILQLPYNLLPIMQR
ncbi:MAG: prenyltransferase/squalene oxidase repeat-containing protein [Phycisphaerae bacterium]